MPLRDVLLNDVDDLIVYIYIYMSLHAIIFAAPSREATAKVSHLATFALASFLRPSPLHDTTTLLT